MITCAAAISSGIWFHPQRVSIKSVSSSLSRTHYPFEKEVGRVSVRAVATKVESDYKVDVWEQTLNKTNTLSLTFQDAISSDPEPSSGENTSEKEMNSKQEASSARNTPKREMNPKRLSSSASQIKKPDHFPVLRYPLGTESAIKAMLEFNTLVFVVDKRADKQSIKDDFKNVFKVRAKKVNTSIMADGRKKAFIMLAPEFKASDLAKKIKIL